MDNSRICKNCKVRFAPIRKNNVFCNVECSKKFFNGRTQLNRHAKSLKIGFGITIEDLPGEIWKDVVGYENLYSVSNLGRVKSLHRFVPSSRTIDRYTRERLLKQAYNKLGYLHVVLAKLGKMKTTKVHRIVAAAFLDNPENKPFINHKNGVKDDNRLVNLEFCTPKENSRHRFDVLGHCQGKLSKEEVFEILSTKYYKGMESKFNISYKALHRVQIRVHYKYWVKEYNEMIKNQQQ